MKLLLVRPVADATMIDIVGPDLGLGLLLAKAKREGWDARLLDCHGFGVTQDDLEEACRAFKPDLVGFKAYTHDVPSINESVARVRRVASDARVIVGGPPPSALGATAAEWFTDVDLLMKGEADRAFPMLLRILERTRTGGRWGYSAKDLADVMGLIWRNDDNIWVQNPQDFPSDLDVVGLPDWSSYDFAALPNWSIRCPAPYVPVQTGRGCPYNCAFCSARNINERKTRRKSVEFVINEIRHYRDRYGVKHFCIIDDNFLGDKAYVKELLDRLKGEKGLTFDCSSNAIRLNQLDPEIIRDLEAAGCTNLALGIESGTDRVLKYLNKSLSVDEIRHYVGMITEHSGMKMHGFFIMGLPSETRREIEQTIRFASTLPIHTANFFLYTPHPGTPLWDRLVSDGKLDPEADPSTFLYESAAGAGREVDDALLKRLGTYAYMRFFLTPWRLKRTIRMVNSRRSLSLAMRAAKSIAGL